MMTAFERGSASKAGAKRVAEAPPYMERPSKTAMAMKKEKTNLASQGHASTREADEKALRYVKILQRGANGVSGILATHDEQGAELIPYSHQRQAVKFCAAATGEAKLIAHDAGCGKTATFFQLMAAIELLVGGGACAIVTVPPACISQWEDTAYQWLNLPNKARTIVATNQAALITQQLLDKVRVLIISRHLLARLYKINWSYEKGVERNASGRWVSRWCRKPNKALHPIWSKKWDLLGVDEAHLCRNPATEWAVSHNQLSSGVDIGNGARAGGCKKRVALTATPVFNRPLDCVGLCVAIDAPPEFQDRKFWSLDRACKTINPASVRLWQRHTDRVTDAILNLPPIHQEFHDFDPALPEKEVVNYNDYVCRAKQLRTRIESGVSSSGGAGDLQKLMLLLQRMQQMLVSPKLAHVGAEHFKKNPAAVAAAAMVETGALLALFERIVALQAEGHERIIVAVGHTQLMAVARRYLVDKSFKKEASIGTILVYDGSLTLQQRQLERNAFMSAERAVLFLSIGAGGTGLHLVPQNVNTPKAGFCRSVVFWGSRPYSPQQVWQTLKRVHRIGAMHEVFVHHIIARGSVDDAINHVHKDKSALAAAVVDDDFSNCDEASGCWKRAGKIVSHCREILESGEFAMEDALESPAEAKAPVAPTSAPLAALGRDVALPIGRTLSAPPPNMLLMQRLQPAHSTTSPLLLQQPAPPSRYFSMAQARTMVPKVAPPPAALARPLAPAAPSVRPPPPTAASRVLQRSVPVPAVAALVFGTPIITTTPSSPPYLAVSAARSMAAPVVTGM